MQTDGALAPGLHLLALCSFALAQPLLDVLGLQVDFFVARHSSAKETVGLVLALLLLPPVLLWGLERVVGLVATRLEGTLHRLFVAVLVALTALPPEVRERVHVAVAVGGVIQTVVAAPRFGRSHRLAAMLPEEAVRGGRAEPVLYLVTGSGDSPSLKGLPTERSGEASRWRW
jgi:hypothetical protein